MGSQEEGGKQDSKGGGLLLKVKAVFFLFREGVIKILSNKTNHEDQFLSVH